MKKADVRKFEQGTAEYVIAHAAWSASSGRGPSVAFRHIRNPKEALRIARGFLTYDEYWLISNARFTRRQLRQIEREKNQMWDDFESTLLSDIDTDLADEYEAALYDDEPVHTFSFGTYFTRPIGAETRFYNMTDTELQAEAKRIITSSSSEEEVQQRLEVELDYPYTISLHTYPHRRRRPTSARTRICPRRTDDAKWSNGHGDDARPQ